METKICGICKQEKKIFDFNKNKIRKDGYQTLCRTCSNIRSNLFYNKNKESQRIIIYKQKNERKNNSRAKVIEYLTSHPCIDCGNNNILVLDFDHKQDKTMNISDMIAGGYIWKSIEKEIAKCDIRCANCHRIKTARDFGYFKLLGMHR
jgi:hypothetical protein